MKVLVINHSREQSGWGESSRNFMMALDAVGIEVVSRPIKLNLGNVQPSNKMLEFESRSANGCDACIQYILPHFMEYHRAFGKNIAYCMLETKNIKRTTWPSYLNLMDEIWAPHSSFQSDAKSNGIDVTAKTVPLCFDTIRYELPYSRLNQINKGTYIFYTISEFTRRKHIPIIIRAFHNEFGRNEPVSLLIKLNSPYENTQEQINNICLNIKEHLRMYKDVDEYHKEMVITEYLPEDKLMSLHCSCDCFVSASYGEGWNQPAFDALSLGNSAVLNDTGGMSDYGREIDTCYLVKNRNEPCMGVTDHAVAEFGKAYESWDAPNIDDLMRKMRLAYSNRGNKERRPDFYNKYSYEAVGQQIKCLLQ